MEELENKYITLWPFLAVFQVAVAVERALKILRSRGVLMFMLRPLWSCDQQVSLPSFVLICMGCWWGFPLQQFHHEPQINREKSDVVSWVVCGTKGGCHQKCCCCLEVHPVFVISHSSVDSKYHAYTPKEILSSSTVLVLSESIANGAMWTCMPRKGWQACKIAWILQAITSIHKIHFLILFYFI